MCQDLIEELPANFETKDSSILRVGRSTSPNACEQPNTMELSDD